MLLRGFPVSELDTSDVGWMYFGLGLHFGTPVSQSNMGDLLGHVRDTGARESDEFVRLYQTTADIA